VTDRDIAMRAVEDPAVARFLRGTLAMERDGTPSICWRGEHGPHTSDFQSNLASLSFGSREAACLYATEPNDHRMSIDAPRVSPWLLRIARPVMNDPDDPFIDLPLLARAIGREATTAIAVRMAEHIVDTGNWQDHFQDLWGSDVAGLLRWRPASMDDLYLVAYQVFDDPEAVGLLQAAGHDGAICGGMGANALETEWRLFDAHHALPAWCPGKYAAARLRIAA
jgi:hypothetical protein